MRRRSFRPAAAGLVTLVAASFGLALWWLRPARVEAVHAERQPAAETVQLPPQVVRQGFPAASADPADLTKSETAWEIEWDITNPMNGPPSYSPLSSSILAIRSAKFMYKDRNGQPRWITPVRNLEIGEIFVPYDPGYPRYDDVSQMNFWIVRADRRNLGPNCVAPGEILSSPDPYKKDKVYKEVHDDGPRWFSDYSSLGQERCRRGEKMLIWCVFFGANYRYVFEYGFGDDGTINCRLGATAHNLLRLQPDQGDTHLHVGCWRFDPDLGDPAGPALGGPEQNVVQVVRRLPRTPRTWKTAGSYLDVPAVQALRTRRRRPRGLRALAAGGIHDRTDREHGPQERQPEAARHRLRPTPRPQRLGARLPGRVRLRQQGLWVTLTEPQQTTFTQVPTYAAERRPIDKQPVTIWHNAPLLHSVQGRGPRPRTE